MKVLDLRCSHGHSFEGWFASEDAFQSQLASGRVECPVCEDRGIRKMLSAPRLNLDTSTALAAVPSSRSEQAAWLGALRQVLANTEDVGSQFAEEARRIHYGESAQRSIRGEASREQTLELLDEGINVLPLQLPASLKEPLQ